MSAGPVVLKFGGTSVADAEAIGRLVRHVTAAHRRARAVVVVSALSGITDRLLHLRGRGGRRRRAGGAAGLDELQQRHEHGGAVGGAGLRGPARARSRPTSPSCATCCTRSARSKDASPRTRDAVAAFGELLSSRIVEAACQAAGLPAVWIDPRRVLITNDTFGCALPSMEETTAAVAAHLAAARRRRPGAGHRRLRRRHHRRA